MRTHPDRLPSPPSELACFEAEALVDAYLDDELAAERRSLFEAHLARCPACADELAWARRVASELRELSAPSCPPAVTRAVLAHAAAHPSPGERLRRLGAALFGSFGGRALWRPAFALLLVAATAVGLHRLLAPPPLPPVPTAVDTYSPAEIAQAQAELRLAFAYLGEISQKAGTTFGTEVENRVVVPVQRSLAGALFPRTEPVEPAEPAEGKPDHASS